MINEKNAKRFCKDDISKIENYEKAIADTTQVWDLHHRLEITLDGEFAHNRDELKRLGMYYNRPYFELIFLTPLEHHRLHGRGISGKTRKKLSGAIKGIQRSDETKRRISEARKGMSFTEEHRQNLSRAKKGENHPNYGTHLSEETRKRISEARKAYWARQRFDEKFVQS